MWLFTPFRLALRVVGRFRSERCGQTAAALSFATLLGMVPMIAIASVLLAQFPFAQNLAETLERFFLGNLLPEKSGVVIAKHVGQFAQRIERVTLLGAGALAATALLQMLTIEKAFDAIWGVKIRPPLWRRVLFHGLAMLLGPVVFGASLLLTSYLTTVSLGLITDTREMLSLAGKIVAFTFNALFFALIYWGLPNRPVLRGHALFGGLVAALGFLGLQKLFAAYIVKFPTYAALYGGFAAIPVFLLWVYFSWGVILVGALLVAELPKARQT